MTWSLDIAGGTWLVLAQMAPYLLFGFAVAGVLSVLVSPTWVERHLGGRGFGPVFKAAIFGVPLPLCSCGVIPVGASIRKHGASRSATVGFLLSTPQTGVDSILATYALLGPVYAVFRPIAALVTGVAGGAAVSLWDGDRTAVDGTAESRNACSDGCGCVERRGHVLADALRYGFLTLPADIARPLLIGIVVAGAIGGVLEEGLLAPYLGGGILAMIVMVLVGIPIYVCATASIPLAVGFMHLGASPGAALVFLVAGPATNAATISVVWRLLGRRSALIYLAAAALGALVSGLVLDLVFARFAAAGSILASHMHHEQVGLLSHAAAVVLLLLLAYGLFRRSHGHEEKTEEVEEDAIALQVNGMTCGHCADAVTRALRETPGVSEAEVDLLSGRAKVQGESVDPPALISAVTALGYEASVVS